MYFNIKPYDYVVLRSDDTLATMRQEQSLLHSFLSDREYNESINNESINIVHKSTGSYFLKVHNRILIPHRLNFF